MSFLPAQEPTRSPQPKEVCRRACGSAVLYRTTCIDICVLTKPQFHDLRHGRFAPASTSSSPFPFENTGLSIVPPTRNGNCNLPSFNVAPDIRATVLVKKLSLVVISANPR